MGRTGFAVLGDTHFVASARADRVRSRLDRRGAAAALAFYAEVTGEVWPRTAGEVRAAASDSVVQARDLVEGGMSATAELHPPRSVPGRPPSWPAAR